MIDEHDAALKKLAKARRQYLEALEGVLETLEAERAAVASRVLPQAQPQPPKSAKRRTNSDSLEPQVCAAAKPFLREQGPHGLTAVHKAARSVAGLEDVSKGAVSAALSRSPEFYSEGKKWHLSEWRESEPSTSAEAPAPQPGLLPPST